MASIGGGIPACVCIDGARTPGATLVGVGMSVMVEARSSVGGLRRECVGSVRVNGGDANGGDSAVSVPGGPIL